MFIHNYIHEFYFYFILASRKYKDFCKEEMQFFTIFTDVEVTYISKIDICVFAFCVFFFYLVIMGRKCD